MNLLNISRTLRLSTGKVALAALALPIAWAFGYALVSSFGLAGGGAHAATLEAWRSVIVDRDFAGAAALSGGVALTVTFLATVVALVLVVEAWPLIRRPWAAALLGVPLATPVLVAALVVGQLLSGGGLVARIAFHLGWIDGPGDFPVLVNDRFAVGIVLAHLLSAIPLLALYFRQVRQSPEIDAYLSLAECLGASPSQSRRRVALPLLLRRGRAMILLIFILTLGSFEIPLLLGRQSPQMLSVLIERKATGFALTERAEAFALATLYFLVVTALLSLYFRWRQVRATPA